MCREREGVVSETKPLPGHAISARAAQADIGSAGPGRRKTGAEEAAHEAGWSVWRLKSGPCNYKQH